jgi:hypothetical protein
MEDIESARELFDRFRVDVDRVSRADDDALTLAEEAVAFRAAFCGNHRTWIAG